MSTLNPAQDALNWGADGPAARPRPKRGWTVYLALAAMIVPALGVLVLGLIAGQAPAEGEIESGVSVASIDVDGQSWSAVSSDLEVAFAEYLDTPITVTAASGSVDVTPAELGISYDLDATRERAEAIGRGGLVSAAGERLVAHTRGYELDPVVRVDEALFMSVIAPLAADVMEAPTNATFAVEDGAIVVRESSNGVGIDPSQALRELLVASSALDSQPLVLRTTVVEPDVTTAELQAVFEDATILADAPIRMSDGSQAWTYGQTDIVNFLTYEDGAVAVDEVALRSSLTALGDSMHQLAQNADLLRQEDGSFTIADETIERSLDVDASSAAVSAAILNGQQEVPLVIVEQEPLVTKERLLPLYRRLTEMVTRGVTLSWSEGALPIDKRAFSESIFWNVNTSDVWFDHERLAEAIRPVAEVATRPPTNLRWVNGQVVATESSLPGLRGDAHASVSSVIDAAMAGNEYAELAVVEDGEVNAAAAGIQISHVLGSSTTYYGDSSANRKTNIEVASRALNGTLIPPHSTFSFNDAIGGTASLEDGYQMGYGIVIEGGEVLTVPSVAGGICQVATTVFQSAFWAGMPIETRSWHLYWIPRYGNGSGGLTGLDATVDPEFGLDFEFNNPTDNWLAISSWANGQNLTIEVWGVHQGWNVQVDAPVITNVVEASTETVRRADYSLNPGQEVKVESAQDGFSASIHRVVTDAEGNVLWDTVFDSYYQPARNLVLYNPS